MSLTIHCKYKNFDSTAQRAEDRRQKFAVNVILNLSTIQIDKQAVVFTHQSIAVSKVLEYVGSLLNEENEETWG